MISHRHQGSVWVQVSDSGVRNCRKMRKFVRRSQTFPSFPSATSLCSDYTLVELGFCWVRTPSSGGGVTLECVTARQLSCCKNITFFFFSPAGCEIINFHNKSRKWRRCRQESSVKGTNRMLLMWRANRLNCAVTSFLWWQHKWSELLKTLSGYSIQQRAVGWMHPLFLSISTWKRDLVTSSWINEAKISPKTTGSFCYRLRLMWPCIR